MRITKPQPHALRVSLVAAAVASCFAAANAIANPTGANVVNGIVTMATPAPGQLLITNSPNSIIHWNGFSIGAGELTRFIQQSPASAVLNRVVTNSPSEIFGALLSNGRVFLINQNGILFGAGSTVDVGGLVASSLNLTNENFLAGNYLFQPVPGAGAVENYGSIQAGQVYLVGPAVTNGGIITSPQGEVVLAAGNSVELMNPGTPDLTVSVTASGNEALNLGQVLAESGRIGIYAGLINQRGMVSANAAYLGADGSIQLRATNATTFAAGSDTFASGALDIATGDLTVAGNVQSGPQTIAASGAVVVRNEPSGFAQLRASGGQSISARSLEVTAQGGGFASIINDLSGPQSIVIDGGGASAGIDVSAGAGDGFAQIFSFAPGGSQSVAVTNADHIRVDGAGGGAAINAAGGGAQAVSIAGSGANAIRIGSAGALGASTIGGGVQQNIVAGLPGQDGSITIEGSAANQRISGFISNPGFGGSQTVSTSGTLSIVGGSASAQPSNFPAGIFHNGTGQQTISAQSIVLQGGATGSGNSAQIGANNGTQLVNAGSIDMVGGIGGANNTALLRSGIGLQTIFADEIQLQGGAAGTANFSVIVAPLQEIWVTGDVTLTGGGSAPSASAGGGALIGGGSSLPTNLSLHVGDDLTLNGGSVSGAALGVGTINVRPTQITVNAGGDVTLNPGAVTGTRIGSRPDALGSGEIVVNAGGTIAMNSAGAGNAGAIRTADGVTLRARTITQGPDAAIQANALVLETQEGASLVGTNSVNALRASNAWFGDVALHNSSPLLTISDVQNFAGAFELRQQGDVLVNGSIFSGPQSFDVSGGLVTQNEPGLFAQLSATGGQSIRAGYIEVNGMSGGGASIANSYGEQSIETGAANATGEGLAVRSLGGFANIVSSQGQQRIEVRNADRMTIDQAAIVNIGGLQTVALTGTGANALTLGSPGAANQSVIGGGGTQVVTAGNTGEQGSITIHGTATGGPFNTIIVSNPVPGGTQTVSTSGALAVFGGSAVSGSSAGIFANGVDGQQTVRAGSILLQGGDTGFGNSAFIGANSGSQVVEAGVGGIALVGGSSGSNNFVHISQQSSNPAATQTMRSEGPVLVQGGDAGTFNYARISAFGGQQTLDFGGTTLLAGAGGLDNFSVIQARSQDITVHGDLALIGRGSAPSPTIGGGARIGGLGGTALTPTNLVLNVDGDLTMTGGSVAGTGALLGNSTGVTAPTNIDISVAGDVTLSGGTAPSTFATIGSRAANLSGGEISIEALGGIALNSSAPDAAAVIRTTDGVTLRAQQVTQGSDARIEAGSLRVETAQGASLGGANRVSQLAMLNSASGNMLFNNASALLNVTGIEQTPGGALALSQDGDLLIGGNVTSGAQSIGATGDFTITPGTGPNVTLQAYGPQSFSAGGNFSLLGGTAANGFAQAGTAGSLQVQTGGDLRLQGGSGARAYALLYGGDEVRLTVGNELHLDGGADLFSFARIQTDADGSIYLTFPNRDRGGYFVNGREGAVFRRFSGFFAGLLPANRGRSLILEYGE